MRSLLIITLAAVLLLAATGCAQIKANIKSVVKVTVYDETGAAYGYVSVKLLDENGAVKYSQNVNERGVTLFEGIPAGTYSFEVVNVNGTSLTVISPESVTVNVGKTARVDLKVSRAAVAEQTYDY